MPYYREQFANRVIPSKFSYGSTRYSAPIIMDSVELLTWRGNQPHANAFGVTQVSDVSADPYAYFLESTSEKRYHDRLAERGLGAEGEPDRGHPFELKRHTLYGRPHTFQDNYIPSVPRVFENCWAMPATGSSILTDIHSGSVFDPAPYKETGLDAFAQQAYLRTAPSAVVFDAGQFLGELREGLPRLTSGFIQSQLKDIKKAGSDYLNVEFGWKPLIDDIQNAGKALLGATDSFSQMGKRVHRRYGLPEKVSTNEFHSPLGGDLTAWYNPFRGFAPSYPVTANGYLVAANTATKAPYIVKKGRSSRRWFEGEFTSFMPLGFDPSNYFDRLSALMNPKITPATLWELAPWSWLVDWNLRIGDTIRANEIHANDRLVMHYGYAMEHSVYDTSVDWHILSGTPSPSGWSGFPRFGKIRSSTEYKRRIRANPYGFRTGGLGSLTGGQTAILGALGLTKLK